MKHGCVPLAAFFLGLSGFCLCFFWWSLTNNASHWGRAKPLSHHSVGALHATRSRNCPDPIWPQFCRKRKEQQNTNPNNTTEGIEKTTSSLDSRPMSKNRRIPERATVCSIILLLYGFLCSNVDTSPVVLPFVRPWLSAQSRSHQVAVDHQPGRKTLVRHQNVPVVY